MTARDALAAEQKHRAALRAARVRVAGALVPTAVAVCLAVVALLMYANARARRYEIAVVRTVGWGAARIVKLFIVKALLLGFVGGVAGAAAGAGVAGLVAARFMDVGGWARILDWRLALGVALGSPLLAVLASWIPALGASTADPASVLQKE